MIELPLVFVAGILGTAHCLGMCGPFALAIGSGAASWPSALGRQGMYTAGRIFTYGVLGAAAGFCGSRLDRSLPAIVNIPAVLAIAAGLLLVYEGLRAAGWLSLGNWTRTSAPSSVCLAGSFFGPFMRQGGMRGVFLAGLFTGLLPCGLLYGMLALAASVHSVVLGGVTMIVFGLGTAPAMMLAGVSGRLINTVSRQRLYHAAAWCLVLTGLVSIGRGVMFLSLDNQPPIGCPACRNAPPMAAR